LSFFPFLGPLPPSLVRPLCNLTPTCYRVSRGSSAHRILSPEMPDRSSTFVSYAEQSSTEMFTLAFCSMWTRSCGFPPLHFRPELSRRQFPSSASLTTVFPPYHTLLLSLLALRQPVLHPFFLLFPLPKGRAHFRLRTYRSHRRTGWAFRRQTEHFFLAGLP